MITTICAWIFLLLNVYPHPGLGYKELIWKVMPGSGSQESEMGEVAKERNGCIYELGLVVGHWGSYPSGDPLRKVQNAPEICPT